MWVAAKTQKQERSCGGSFSFYRHLIEPYWAGGPDEKTAAPLHRLCTLARKMHVRSILIEDVLTRPDVAAEIAHLQTWSDTPVGEVRAAAVSFITRPAAKGRKDRALTADQVIGQAALITFPTATGPHTYVYEAVFRLPRDGRSGEKLLLNNYVPVSRAFEVTVSGTKVEIVGSVFHQQNGVTSLCVHSAVRALLRNLDGQTASTEELNTIWNYKGGPHNIQVPELLSAFTHYGLTPVPYDLTDKNTGFGESAEETAWRTLTCLAESATSGALILESTGPAQHVVSVLGFTLNTDEWLPQAAPTYLEGRANEVSSSAWIDHLVVHDDLLGPYYCISRAGLYDRAGPGTMRPRSAIALLPPGVDVSPVKAEGLARGAFEVLAADLAQLRLPRGIWWELLTRAEARRVYRTTLVRREDYMASLRTGPFRRPANRVLAGRVLDMAGPTLPERFWLVEITLPQLFVGNRAKLGEMLISTDSGPEKAIDAVCGFRLPSVMGWRDGPQLVATRFPLARHRPLLAPLYHPNGW